MPFREKMKKAFGRSSSSSSSPTPTLLTTIPSTTSSSKKSKKSKKTETYENWPEHIYKPHEMPRPKYQGVVDKKHNDRLEAFSFGGALEAMRRRSGQSQYSPMGSRLPSRGPSRGPSRSSQVKGGDRMGYGAGGELMESGEADDDGGNGEDFRACLWGCGDDLLMRCSGLVEEADERGYGCGGGERRWRWR